MSSPFVVSEPIAAWYFVHAAKIGEERLERFEMRKIVVNLHTPFIRDALQRMQSFLLS
jgi:hypothetical protein